MERFTSNGQNAHLRELTMWRMIFLLFVLMAFAQPVSGQQRSRADSACTKAERAVSMNDGARAYARTLAVLVGCPAIGPRVLAGQWSAPPADSLALEALGGASAMLRDQRVYDAAKAVAENPRRGHLIRLMAFRVLVGHFDACLAIAYRTPRYPELGGREYVWFGTSDHYVGRSGSQSLASTVRGDVVTILRRLVDDATDEVVRMIAAYLAQRLGEMSEPVTCLH